MFSRFMLSLSVVLAAVASCAHSSTLISPEEATLDAAAETLREQILDRYREAEVRTIGIASFARVDLIKPNAQYESVVPRLGVQIANTLQNEMFVPERFHLVERLRMEAVLREASLDESGLLGEGALKSPRLAGVDYVLLGTLQRRESTIRVDARLVQVATGRIASVASAALPLSPYIKRLYEDYPGREKEYNRAIAATGSWQPLASMDRGKYTVQIGAQGSWSMTDDGQLLAAEGSAVNPSGWGDYRVVANMNHGALICRSSADGGYFGIGEIQLHGPAIIECRINDSAVGNNGGALTVTAIVTVLDEE